IEDVLGEDPALRRNAGGRSEQVAVEKEAVVHLDNRLVTSGEVPSCADTRRKCLLVVTEQARVVVPDAGGDGHIRSRLPRVLREDRYVVRPDIDIQIAISC